MKNIKLEHGSGGALSRELTEDVIYPIIKNDTYTELSDAAVVKIEGEIAFTTDTFVVDPIFFPGGDIGKLAVCGTCNDLSVSGAEPLYLSLGLVLEEGFSIDELKRVLKSVKSTADPAGVKIITGDTKVVPKGKGGKIFINTTGIGRKVFQYTITTRRIRPGDAVIVTGPLGSHGIAVMASRESISIGSQIKSDTAFLYPMCRSLFDIGTDLRFLRDATRGGVAAILNEICADNNFGIDIYESQIPVLPDVQAVSDILGLNPIEIANEGVLIVIVAEKSVSAAIDTIKQHVAGRKTALIGKITETYPGKVILETKIGGKRILDYPRGLLLPRIC